MPSSRPQSAPTPVRPVEKSVFFTGGVGDVFAILSFFSEEEMRSWRKVYFATRKEQMLLELFRALPWGSSWTYESLWNDFTNFWCFMSFEDLCRRAPHSKHRTKGPIDLSISKVFPQIHHKTLSFQGSPFLNHPLADTSGFELPDEYVIVSPFSTDKRDRRRDFLEADWTNCRRILKEWNLPGVIINRGDDKIPTDWRYDLSNKTSVCEAVELLKGASGYIGVDSWLSVLASQKFDLSRLRVKCKNLHCIHNAVCYFAPHDTFPFLTKTLPER